MNENVRSPFYKMDENKKPIPISIEEFSELMAGDNLWRRIAYDTFLGESIIVSTVFLGIDASFGDDKNALFFETMIFFPTDDNERQFRYKTHDEAIRAHALACEIVLDKINS